jgi:gas vesicle protein
MKVTLVIIGVIAVAVVLLLSAVQLAKKGIVKDKNNNNIPDFVDEAVEKVTVKTKAVKKETVKRVKAVKKEIEDVVDTIKEVGNQLEDIPKAVKGKKRPGRKEQL